MVVTVETVEYSVNGKHFRCQTKPDLFSPKGLDIGTRLLLESIRDFGYQTALDWGCGWGAISLYLAAAAPSASILGLDANIGAVKLAGAWQFLNRGGTLVIVVKARLKPWVNRAMKKVFGNVKIIARGPKNVVLAAAK